ncbi:MAG TPA: hypothetical protein VK988_01165 [Acidimicrobiales bacterium]|nr:hypothetical protein [Acidimicrobiales bacterium]
MTDGLDAITRGSIGFFWPCAEGIPDLDKDEPERGHIHIEDRWAIIHVLEEDVEKSWLATDDELAPVAIVALMADDAAVLLEVRGPYRKRWFGIRASSTRYDARTVVGGLDVTRLCSTDPLALHAHFHGISSWAGLTSLQEVSTMKPSGRLESLTIELRGSGQRAVRIDGGRRIVMSSTWNVSGPSDQRIVNAPVAIGCETSRPRPTWELLQPLLHVQDLINVAYGGFLAAIPGTAQMCLRPDQHDRFPSTPWMWNGALMSPPKGASTPGTNSVPMFSLGTLGGFDSLRRWVRLARRHPRAVGPVVNLYRHGPSTPAVALLETAAGIEYWVKSHRPAQWTTASKYATSLARKMGTAFADWIGDPQAWAKAFWQANNELKHEPTFSPDSNDLIDLAVSGRYLLTASILDQVACSKAASRAIFGSHRLAETGRRLRERLS